VLLLLVSLAFALAATVLLVLGLLGDGGLTLIGLSIGCSAAAALALGTALARRPVTAA
jgi:hypothetical protein